MLVEEFQSDGRAVIAAGDERKPHEFRVLVDQVLEDETPTDIGRFVSKEERELRDALGVK